MKKFLYIWIFCAFFLGCNQAMAHEEKEVYRSDDLVIHQITANVYRHVSYLETEGYGKVPCNGMIIAGQGEALVFDTPVDDKGSRELIDWIAGMLGAKIIAVVPTHYHEDNLGGLNEFHKEGIPSYALRKTIDITKEYGLPQPQQAFDDSLELRVGGRQVIVEFPGEGHTCDNVVGYFPTENILFGGCLVKALRSGKGNLEEASVDQWAQSVRNVKAKYPQTVWIVPGHGEPGGPELLDYTIGMFRQ